MTALASIEETFERRSPAEARARTLARRYREFGGLGLLRELIEREFPGRIAVVSSFGAEAAVLLDLVARVEPATPVIFLDSGKHFPETIAYRERLVDHLGLTDVRIVEPDPRDVAAVDGDGELWLHDSDRCCELRKVLPLERALEGFDAWISGRKRFHGGTRSALPGFEAEGGRVKVNILAGWTPAAIRATFLRRGLPRHPLVAEGYSSIGCEPCTARVAEGDAARAGRWVYAEKTECGIHRAPWAGAGP